MTGPEKEALGEVGGVPLPHLKSHVWEARLKGWERKLDMYFGSGGVVKDEVVKDEVDTLPV